MACNWNSMNNQRNRCLTQTTSIQIPKVQESKKTVSSLKHKAPSGDQTQNNASSSWSRHVKIGIEVTDWQNRTHTPLQKLISTWKFNQRLNNSRSNSDTKVIVYMYMVSVESHLKRIHTKVKDRQTKNPSWWTSNTKASLEIKHNKQNAVRL